MNSYSFRFHSSQMLVQMLAQMHVTVIFNEQLEVQMQTQMSVHR